MKILLINTCFEKESLHNLEFVRPIENILKKQNKKYEIQHYKELKNIEQYNKIIICGNALKDNEFIKEDFPWIKTYKKSILGICAGAQIIAKKFNSNITKKQEIGLFKPEIIKEDKIIKNLKLNEIYCLHNNSFELPKEFDLILKTSQSQLIKHKKKEIYATLFHPEVREEKLIENFINL